MTLPSRKFLSLAIAILFGAGIIFFAWRTVSVVKNSDQSEAGAAPANESWRDALKVIPEDSLRHLLGASAGNASSTVAREATTTTDLLGRELLTSYGLAQKALGATPMTDAQTQAITDILSGKAMADPDIRRYTVRDLTIVPVSTSTLIAYQKDIAKAFGDFARKNTVNEVVVLAEAMNAKDPAKLLPLKDSAKNLAILVGTLLAMKTPRSMANLQLFFVQNYSLVLSGIADMEQILADPTIGLRGVAKYQKGMNTLKTFLELIQKTK